MIIHEENTHWERIMPGGPKGKGKFEAYYTQLKYHDERNVLFSVGPHADVVVHWRYVPFSVRKQLSQADEKTVLPDRNYFKGDMRR